MVLQFSQDKTSIERSTYSILEWLGDIGGLFDALKALGAFFAGPFTTMALKKELAASFIKPLLR